MKTPGGIVVERGRSLPTLLKGYPKDTQQVPGHVTYLQSQVDIGHRSMLDLLSKLLPNTFQTALAESV